MYVIILFTYLLEIENTTFNFNNEVYRECTSNWTFCFQWKLISGTT